MEILIDVDVGYSNIISTYYPVVHIQRRTK